MPNHNWVLIVSAAASLLDAACAVVVEGSIRLPANRIKFLTKFCFDFDTTGGTAGQWDIRVLSASPAKHGWIQLILFDDEAFSYPHDENVDGEFRCDGPRLKQATKWQGDMDAETLPRFGSFQLPLTERLRPRWWYVSLVDCSGEDHDVEFSIHMTNPNQGWQQEMSMDQCGLRLLGVFLVIYLILCYTQLFALMMRSSARTKHPLRLLLTTGIASACWGMIIFMGEAVWLSHKGERSLFLYFIAKSFKAVSKFIMYSMLMLLSKGKGISQALSTRDVFYAAQCFAPFFMTCIGLELWGEYSESRLYTNGFVYCTKIGGFLVFVDLLLCAFYMRNSYRSYCAEVEPERRFFYRHWASWYVVAFLILPLAALLSMLVSPWVRSTVIVIFTNSAHAAIFASLIIGLWPERTQAFFCVDNETLAAKFGKEIELLDPDAGDQSPLRARTPKNGETDPCFFPTDEQEM